MKIGIICAIDSWGGLEINNVRLCGWLGDRGNDVTLFCKPGSHVEKEAVKNKIKTLPIIHKQRHLNVKRAVELAAKVKEAGIDILVIGHYHHFYLAVMAKVFSSHKFKLVYWQHMQVNLVKKDFYHRYFFQKLDAWISPLLYLEKQLKENTPINPAKVTVIPFGIETDRFSSVKSSAKEARSFFQLPPNAFIIGTIGRIDTQKGQEYLLRALGMLQKEGKEIYGLIIGEETIGHEGYLDHLKEICKKEGLEDRVFFRGFTSEIALAYAALDVFVMSSLSEPIGMVTVEAMAAGIPVIGTNRGGTKELLEDGRLGYLFEPGDTQGLKEKILQLIEQPDLREEKIIQAKEKAISYYGYENQCVLFEQLFNKMMLG